MRHLSHLTLHILPPILILIALAACRPGPTLPPAETPALASPMPGRRPFCGDGRCNGSENPTNCPQDCAPAEAIPPPPLPTATPSPSPSQTPIPPTNTPLPPTATPAPTPTPLPPAITPATSTLPVILSFSADRTTLVEGESVTLRWQAQGGQEAFITWVGANGMLAGPGGPLEPDEGAVTVSPTGDGDIWLTVFNEAGSVEAHLSLEIRCAHAWAPALADNPPRTRCPGPLAVGPAAQQPFEHGFMIWFGPAQQIFLFFEEPGPHYSVVTDEFQEGMPESDPSLVPPAGLYQPVRGFGLVWRKNPNVREALGWATAPETGFETWVQSYQELGLHNAYTFIQGIDGTIYRLVAMGGGWEVYGP